jgi:anaerobic magnesium-protoporphyrin IX monomethyl ester cyclase
MKVLLVVKSKMMENLGVMYLKSVIQHNCNHECRIANVNEAFTVFVRWEPDMVGFSIMTGDKNRFKLLAKAIRDITAKPPTIVVGGPDPTFFPEGYDWADMIIKGEGEQSLADLLGTNQVYGDINAIPWPARDDFPNMRVRDFISSRGCPYKCSYCYNAKWAELFPEQKGIRVRSVEDVIGEIKFVNPEYVFFQDSCFGVNMEWMEEFAGAYENIGKPYQCNFRPEQITVERAVLLADSGCAAVRMALESGVNRLRGLIGRNGVRLQKVREAAEILKEFEIQLMLQNIIGLPTSTIEDDLFTLELNIQYQPTYSWVSIFQPYPGTVLGDQCRAEGWYQGDYSNLSDSFFDTSYLEFEKDHKEQLEILQKIFELCVRMKYLPKPDELTYNNLPKLIHHITRKEGDRKLYRGLL